MAKVSKTDLDAERYEMQQLKKGVPHPKAERMEKNFMKRRDRRSSRR